MTTQAVTAEDREIIATLLIELSHKYGGALVYREIKTWCKHVEESVMENNREEAIALQEWIKMNDETVH